MADAPVQLTDPNGPVQPTPQSVTGPLGDPTQTSPVNTQLSQAALTGDGSLPPPRTNLQNVEGPFGSKGILGSILGHVGDALLVNAGLKAEYQPKVQAAKAADALEGFVNDPVGAVQRYARVDPDKAQQMYNDMVLNTARQAEAAKNTQAAAQARALAPFQQIKAQNDAYVGAKSLAATANANNSSAIYNNILRLMKQSGAVDPTFPTTSDPDALKAWAQTAIDPAKQQELSLQSQRDTEANRHNLQTEKIGQQNADSTAANVQSEITYRPVTAGASATSAAAAASNAANNAASAPDKRELTKAEIAKNAAQARYQAALAAHQERRNGLAAGAKVGGPTVGAVQNGYKFNGGNPADPKSWSKI